MSKEEKKEKENFFAASARFLSEVWNEIDFRKGKGRVSWPTLDSVQASTHVVIMSSIGLGIFIGVIDFILGKLLNLIIIQSTNGIG